MEITRQARELLRGQRTAAAAVEFVHFAAGLLLLLLYLAVLRLLGLSAETVVRLPDIAAGKWAYPLLTLLFLVADWLAISPVLAGRASFYYKISRGELPAFTTVFKYFGSGYSRALRWRFSGTLRRLLDILACLSPAAFVSGMTGAIRQSGSLTPKDDYYIMMGNAISAFLLIAGLFVLSIISLRRLPALFLLVLEDNDVNHNKKIFKTAALKMRGNIAGMFHFYLIWVGRLAPCLLLFPKFFLFPVFYTAKTLKAIRIINSEHIKKQPAALQKTMTLPDF